MDAQWPPYECVTYSCVTTSTGICNVSQLLQVIISNSHCRNINYDVMVEVAMDGRTTVEQYGYHSVSLGITRYHSVHGVHRVAYCSVS